MAFCKNLYPFHELFLQAFLDSASKQTGSCSGISGRNQIGYLSRKQRYEWHAALSQYLALHLIFCSRRRVARLPTASPTSLSHFTCRIIPERGSVAVYDIEGGHRVKPSTQESRRPSCNTICPHLIKTNRFFETTRFIFPYMYVGNCHTEMALVTQWRQSRDLGQSPSPTFYI